MIKKQLPYFLAVFAGLVFIFSGAAKLFPIYAFEHQIVTDNLMGYTLAQLFSRGLIGFEIGLGLLLMLKWNVKELVIPAALILLASFTIYLVYELWISGGRYTSCGCFGELLPMSVGASILKNTILIALLVYIRFLIPENQGSTGLQIVLFIAIYAALFIVFPMKNYEPLKVVPLPVANVQSLENDSTSGTVTTTRQPVNDTIKKAKVEALPPQVQSMYSAYADFLWQGKNVRVDVNAGKKLVCLLSLDCDHCIAAATEIAKLQGQKGMPQTVAMFFGDESELQPFLTKTHLNAPYRILEPEKFFPMIKNVPPRITFLNNGNIIGDWNGEEFKISELKKLLSL